MIKKIVLISSVLLTGCTMMTSNNDAKPASNPSLNNTQSASTLNTKNDVTETSQNQDINLSPATPQKKSIQHSDSMTSDNNNETIVTKETQNASENISNDNLPKAVLNTVNESPIKMMNNSILIIQNLLEKHAKQIEKNPKELKVIIDKYLIPNIDTNKIAGIMLGPKWRTATPEQKSEFINQFLTLLTNLYAKNIAKVGKYKIEFNSLPKSVWQGKNYVQATGRVINLNNTNSPGSNITVYIVKDDNRWKIYDIAVEGISIMKNYQSQFRPIQTMEQAIQGVKKVNARSQG